ncbi:retinol dehydrogenase 12-like [Microplitis mediator]|uniref:retinol dehydrogenase 12-like n=1 Tax=Microplitis mediator TaxID=375433 RepID=UPI0025521A6C|nr:retinol dehydrogenase 12-like [Microplitis mediator]
MKLFVVNFLGIMIIAANLAGWSEGIFLNDYCEDFKIDKNIDLSDKIIVLTGATSGIGLETARFLYQRGAKVIIPSRNITKAQRAVEDIKKSNNPTADLIIYQLDLNNFESVRNCAEKIVNDYEKIDILINNAGIVVDKFMKSIDGYETHLQTNYLSPFLFTLLLLPALAKSNEARIINLTSLSHYIGVINFDDLNTENPFSTVFAYSQSKLSISLFTQELTRKLQKNNLTNIHVYDVDPSLVKTELLDKFFPSSLTALIEPILKNNKQGAGTTIYCATSPLVAHQTGLYYINCDVTTPALRAMSPSLAEKLWNKTIELINYSSPLLSLK